MDQPQVYKHRAPKAKPKKPNPKPKVAAGKRKDKKPRKKRVNGSKIQRYSADGATLLETYSCMVDAVADKKLLGEEADVQEIYLDHDQIKQAITAKTLYLGFRWASLKRSFHDSTVQDIGDPNKPPCPYREYVAMIDLTKTTIVKVFPDRQAAALDRKFRGAAAISNSIKRGSQAGGHFFKMWNDCSDLMKEDYMSREALPAPRTSIKKIPIYQLHPDTGDVIKEFPTMVDVIRAINISRASLTLAMAHGTVVKGFKWRLKTMDIPMNTPVNVL